MKKYFYIIGMLVSIQANSQTPEDAIRYSFFPQNGTARTLAVGGAMGSLGGDITATFVNPAGLGFFRTNEAVFSPSFLLNKNKNEYRGTTSSNNKNSFTIAPMGFIFGSGSDEKKKSSQAFAIAFTQTANFNNRVAFTGLNNQSSYSEQFAEEFARSGRSIQDVLNTNSPLPFTAAPALNTFLIDTATIGGNVIVRGTAEGILDAGGALEQSYLRNSSGGVYELGIGAATNDNEHWLFGGSIGIPLVYQDSRTSLTERDTSSNSMNGFSSSTFTDDVRTTGAGLNLKVGAIYRPKEYIRFGLSVQSPSFMQLTEERTTTINTALESPSGVKENFSESSTTFTSGQPGENDYYQMTPWKAILSGSYVFRETQDVTRQRGFITADVEYVNHKGSRFRTAIEENVEDFKPYYDGLNDVVQTEYKGAFNFRVGGELKFKTIMARLGFAHYGNPYDDSKLKASRTIYSGGLGYRNKGYFVDLTYVYSDNKDVVFPYRLQDRANTFASTQNNRGNIVATVGIKF